MYNGFEILHVFKENNAKRQTLIFGDFSSLSHYRLFVILPSSKRKVDKNPKNYDNFIGDKTTI